MRCKPSEKPTMKYKKGLWSPDEDQKLRLYVMNYGNRCWSTVPVNAGLERSGKSCRLRWINYLRPGLKRGAFSIQEEENILELHRLLGNKWSQISQHLPGRTDNEIKNHWHSHLKKRLATLEKHEANPKLNYNNSKMTIIESSSSSPNTINVKNSSSADADPSVPPVCHVSSLPKILFADWINLDDPLSNDGSTVSNGSNDDMFHTQMKIDQIFDFKDEDFNIDDFMYM